MKINSKRLVAVLICLAMVLAVLPMAVFAVDTVTVYYYNANSWANVAVYWWGSAGSNPGWPGENMTDLGNGYWSYEIPADLAGKEGVIFNNTTGAQTSNLTLPTDGKTCFDGANWITYTGEELDITIEYYLRGSMNSWGADASNKMTDKGNGIYEISMDLAAGTYEYKAGTSDWSTAVPGGDNLVMTLEEDDTVTFVLDLTANSLTYTLASGTVVVIDYFLRGDMNEWAANDDTKMIDNGDGTYSITIDIATGSYEYKAATADWSFSVPGVDNAILNVTSDCAVTFVLDLAAGTLVASGDGVDSFVSKDYFVAGQEGLCGSDWAVNDEANKMEEIAEGVYSIIFENIAAGEYQFKVTNGTWDICWGDAEGPEGNCLVTVEVESNVTITFDKETETITVDVDALVVEPPVTEPSETDPVVTDPIVTDPVITEPSETDPVITEPSETDPVVTDPVVTDPVVTDPVVTDPVVTDPVVTDPVVTDPVVTDPVVTDPVVTDPVVTDPVVTDPVVTDPVVTDPVVTDPVVTDPVVTDPVVTDPVVTDPVVTDPVVTDPVVTDPAETEPVETKPAETEPAVLSEYRIVGSADFLGNWDAAHEAGRMTEIGDGLYEITFKNVAAGDYEFKVTMGSWEKNWGIGGQDGANFQFSVEDAGDVTIVFNVNDGSVNVKLPTIPETGDMGLTAVCVAMLAAAAGLVCTVSKKKED